MHSLPGPRRCLQYSLALPAAQAQQPTAAEAAVPEPEAEVQKQKALLVAALLVA